MHFQYHFVLEIAAVFAAAVDFAVAGSIDRFFVFVSGFISSIGNG